MTTPNNGGAAIALLSSLMLAGCLPGPEAPEPEREPTTATAEVVRLPDAGYVAVYRITDREYGVVCYVSQSNSNGRGGVSCMVHSP